MRRALCELGENVDILSCMSIPHQVDSEFSFGSLMTEVEQGLRFARTANSCNEPEEARGHMLKAWAAYDTIQARKDGIEMSESSVAEFEAGLAQLSLALTQLSGKRWVAD